MSKEDGYKIRNKEGIHFITFTVVGWVDVFSRKEYVDILLNSIQYCQQQKGLVVHAWCVMTNHVHLVVSAKQNNTSDILRDFKKFTSKHIIQAITNNPQESRKEWMLNIFRESGQNNSRNSEFQFWQQNNQPKELYSNEFTMQKLDYIHSNPVTAGIVEYPEHYLYSSAKDYRGEPGLIVVELLD